MPAKLNPWYALPTGTEQVALPDSCYLSRERGGYLDMKVNLNIVGLPVSSDPTYSAYSLLLHLKDQAGGDAGVVENVKRYNRDT